MQPRDLQISRKLKRYTKTLLCALIAMGKACVFFESAVFGLAGEDIGRIAQQTGVQLNSEQSGGGSGVIVSRNGSVYTVLTANHVVQTVTDQYTVRTLDRREHPVQSIVSLQDRPGKPDLAMVMFTSESPYEVATLGDSDQVTPGAEVFVYGFPALPNQQERESELSFGRVTSRPASRQWGYTLRYDANTLGGMSGGPVFDGEGRVVGIHGSGDQVDTARTINGEPLIGIKAGFNAGIPINTFLALLPQLQVSLTDITTQTTPLPPSRINLETPSTAEDFYVRGQVLADQGNPEQAISDYSQAIATDPRDPRVYSRRGIEKLKLGQFAGAEQDFTTAIELAPGYYLVAYLNRGFVRNRLGNYEGAMQDLDRVIQLDPTEIKAYINRAEARRALGDLEGLKADLRKTLEFDPVYASDYIRRCAAWIRLADFQAAIGECNQGLEKEPDVVDRADAYYNLGVAYHSLGQSEQAVSLYSQALTVEPGFIDVYINRSVAYKNLGRVGEALQDCQSAADLAQQQNNSELYQLAIGCVNQLQ